MCLARQHQTPKHSTGALQKSAEARACATVAWLQIISAATSGACIAFAVHQP
jgi:hypothetical protein